MLRRWWRCGVALVLYSAAALPIHAQSYDAHSALRAATQLLQQGEYPHALHDFTLIAAQSRDDIQIHASLGQVRALRGVGRYAEAVTLADHVVRQLWHTNRGSPQLPEAHALLASVARLNGQYAQALSNATLAQMAWGNARACAAADTVELLLTRGWLAHTFGYAHQAWQLLTQLEGCTDILQADPVVDAQHWTFRAALLQAARDGRSPWFLLGVAVDETPAAAWDAADARLRTVQPNHPYRMALLLERARAAADAGELSEAHRVLDAADDLMHQQSWLGQHPWMLRLWLQRLQLPSAEMMADPQMRNAQFDALVRDAQSILGRQHPGLVAIYEAYAHMLGECAGTATLGEPLRVRCAAQQAHVQQRAQHLRRIIIRYNPWQ